MPSDSTRKVVPPTEIESVSLGLQPRVITRLRKRENTRIVNGVRVALVIILFSGQKPDDYQSLFLAVSGSFLRNFDLSSSLSGADENILLKMVHPTGIEPVVLCVRGN